MLVNVVLQKVLCILCVDPSQGGIGERELLYREWHRALEPVSCWPNGCRKGEFDGNRNHKVCLLNSFLEAFLSLKCHSISPLQQGIKWGQIGGWIEPALQFILLENIPMTILSKSKIIAFRQCPKRLWLELHRPELKEVSESSEAAFEIGYEVGDMARSIYDPNGEGALLDVKAEGKEGAIARTTDLLATTRNPIFEAGFQAAGGLAFADVLLPDETNGKPAWRMVEVKASTSIKDYQRDDVAVQAHIARSSGIPLTSVSLAHVDNTWVYQGDGDYNGLLTENDLTEEAFARSGEVAEWISQAQAVAALAEEPQVETGPQCSDPFECSFCGYCFRDQVSPEYPISGLPNFRKHDVCEELGIDDLREVPDHLLNEKQRRVKDHTVSGTAYFDAKGAREALAPYGFPARFLDFETIQFPVPIWAGTRPYEAIPFQFSLHTLDEYGTLEDTAFLDLSGQDPTYGFSKALVDNCGSEGPIFVYHQGVEKRFIREMAVRHPEFSEALEALLPRVVDLLPIARAHYYHPSMKGSWSIKAVLPAVCPDLNYDDLEGVQEGNAAMAVFREAIHPKTDPARCSEIEAQLLAYCKLDTLAMVILWEFFNSHMNSATK